MIRFAKVRRLVICGLSITMLIFVIVLLDDLLRYNNRLRVYNTMNSRVQITDTSYYRDGQQVDHLLRFETVQPVPFALELSSNGRTNVLQDLAVANTRQDTVVHQRADRTHANLVIPLTLAVNGSSTLFPCITTEIENLNFHICTYSPVEDFVVSGTFLNDGYFEADVVSKVLREIRQDDHVQLVDIGANIGTYTLPASRLTAVLSVEPNLESMKRLAKSVVLGEVVGSISLVLNAVSNRRVTQRLAYDLMNRGDSFLLDESVEYGCNNDSSFTTYMIHCTDHPVETILLDDLLPLMRKKRAVIKIDVQGHEIDVFTESTAAKFFREVDVTMIFMEWEEYNLAASVNVKDKRRSSEIDEFLGFFYKRNYEAFDTNYAKLPRNWTAWPNNILLQKDK